MPYVTFIAWQRYARKHALERANAQKRQSAGLGGRAPGPPASEWQRYQDELKARG